MTRQPLRISVAAALVATLVAFEWPALYAAAAGNAGPQRGKPPGDGGFATFGNLPSFGHGSEALAVNDAGTVIVGHAWDSQDILHAVRWTLQGGTWAMTSLPRPAGSTSAIGRAVNNNGDAAGNDFPAALAHAVLWPASGGFTILNCAADPGRIAGVYGISANAQVAVGNVQYLDENNTIVRAAGSVWAPGQCRQEFPPLVAGASSSAYAVNGDGTLVGGGASGVPVRWRLSGGQWLIEQLDTLTGIVLGANTIGDMAGQVDVPCGSVNDCARAEIWYADGGLRQLGTLGGNDSWARDINSNGEVVGGSTSPRNGNTAYFWSESRGMLQLPFQGRWAAANALSNVRSDGTRLVVGMSSSGDALVWVVRNP